MIQGKKLYIYAKPIPSEHFTWFTSYKSLLSIFALSQHIRYIWWLEVFFLSICINITLVWIVYRYNIDYTNWFSACINFHIIVEQQKKEPYEWKKRIFINSWYNIRYSIHFHRKFNPKTKICIVYSRRFSRSTKKNNSI